MADELVTDQYPPNRLRDQQARSKSAGPIKPEQKVKNEPVVEGVVIRRKKGFWRSAKDYVQSDEFGAIGSFLVNDVAVPAVQNLIYDIIDNGAERILFGSSGRTRGRRPDRRHPQYVSYSKTSSERTDRREISSAARRTHDFGEIIFASRAEADEVLNTMASLIEQYGQTSVLDLYELSGIKDVSFADDKWGWTQLRTASVVRVRDGYLLDLPRTESLN